MHSTGNSQCTFVEEKIEDKGFDLIISLIFMTN